ncbi:MAG: hypothetical protein IJI25_05515 [Eubacterium sp.]|nr:hypothetical protein [Eubacterium sp.]
MITDQFRGAKDAAALMEEVTGLFSCGDMAEEYMDTFMLAIQQAYFDGKRKNKKYTPKKYRKDPETNQSLPSLN